MTRKIHYVWLGGRPKSSGAQFCINSWKRCFPDWEIVEWNEQNFDIQKYSFVRQAIEERQFAFAADCIRLIVLKHFGGIYMDVDVEVLTNFENYLTADFVSGVTHSTDMQTNGLGIQTGFMYANPSAEVVVRFLKDVYADGNRDFTYSGDSDDALIIDRSLIRFLHKNYELKFEDKTQALRDGQGMIFKSDIFASSRSRSDMSVLIHWYTQSWNNNNICFKERVRRVMKNHFLPLYKFLAKIAYRK